VFLNPQLQTGPSNDIYEPPWEVTIPNSAMTPGTHNKSTALLKLLDQNGKSKSRESHCASRGVKCHSFRSRETQWKGTL